MQVRKFEASSMREALAAVKDALGPDAIIVATRALPAKGLFGKHRIEVTAALEAPQAEADPAVDNALPEQVQASALDPLRRELRAIRTEMRQHEHEPEELRQQLKEVRELMGNLSRRAAGGRTQTPTWALRALQCADVNPRLAHVLAREVVRRMRATDLQNISDDEAPEQARMLKDVIRGILRADLRGISGPQQRRLALVGPTGVGKTTTIAKLAANAAVLEGRSVVLVSLDTYRVGAFEQLQQYAKMMNVPVHAARDKERFSAILRENSRADLIFVDTAGRGPVDGGEYMEHLRHFFEGNDIAPLMTISAATRSNELEALSDVYRSIEPVGTIFTKLDETMVLGAILNAQQAYKVPMTYVTMGQRVPEDIAPADPLILADRIVDSAAAALEHDAKVSEQAKDGRHVHT